VLTEGIEIFIIFVRLKNGNFMKRAILAILLLCLLAPLADAQLWKVRRYELSAGLGPSMFFGDIGGFSKTENILGLKDLSFLQTRYNVNLNFKYRITQQISARFSLTQGLLHATDARGSNEARGYENSISIIEPALIGEYYFIKSNSENLYSFVSGRGGFFGSILKSIDVYAFTGFGGLIYSGKPNDLLKARQAELGIKPSGFTGIIPLGLGANLAVSPVLSYGLEFGGRYSFTDNLDGYTSQFSSSNDVYYFLNFTVVYKMRTTKQGFPTFRK
jgi:hypothetical protein